MRSLRQGKWFGFCLVLAAAAVSGTIVSNQVDAAEKTSASNKKTAKIAERRTESGKPAANTPARQKTGRRPDFVGESKPIVKGETGGFPDLPFGITSFGSTIDNDAIYVYGGHTGTAHGYSVKDQSNAFLRLDLKKSKQWERLPTGPKLQGLALVAHAGKVYRVGGFSAKNKEGDKQSLWSTAEVAAYDVKNKTWETLSPMPTPRSSHDAAVVDGKLYVVGGWSMQGPGKTVWASTALVADLANSPLVWKEIAKPPFERRALSVAGLHHKVYAIGGMQKKGGITREVAVYDPATDTWSQAPSLTGGMMDGFGTAAFEARGALYVSTYKGLLQKLDLAKKTWVVDRELANGRFFHRMLPDSQQRLIVLGGANMSSGKYLELEVVDLSKKPLAKSPQKRAETKPAKEPNKKAEKTAN